MKLLHASTQPGELQRFKTALQSAGIDCVIRNELTSGLAPEIPLTESTPELWLLDDELLPKAQEILTDLNRKPDAVGEPWICPQCKEVLEGQFTSCWKCGANRATA